MAGNTTPLVGDFTSIPPKKRTVAKDRNDPYPFEDMARDSKTKPGVAIKAAEDVPLAHIKAVRSYRGAPFEDSSGHILVQMRNSEVNEDGSRHGDVYMTWIDTTNK